MEELNQNTERLEEQSEKDINQERLDDATFEPRADVEQSGDYQQAEAVQDSVVSLIANEQAVDWGDGHTEDNKINKNSAETEQASKPELPRQEANVQEQQMEKDITEKGLQEEDLEEGFLSPEGPEGLNGIPGNESGFGRDVSDGLTGFGFDGGTDDLTKGPENDGGGLIPGAGGPGEDLMDGGGKGGSFWEFNLMPIKQGQYERSKELTNMEAATKDQQESEENNTVEDLKYDEHWTPESEPPAGYEKPDENGITPATPEDYEDSDEDRNHFYEAQLVWDNTDKDTDPELGGAVRSDEPDQKYDQSLISNTTENQTKGKTEISFTADAADKIEQALDDKLSMGAQKTGAEVITDPSEPGEDQSAKKEISKEG